VDHENRGILNFEDKSVASYKPSVLNNMYHFKEAHVKVTPKWMKQKNDYADFFNYYERMVVQGTIQGQVFICLMEIF
jgi:hypothetical protein